MPSNLSSTEKPETGNPGTDEWGTLVLYGSNIHMDDHPTCSLWSMPLQQMTMPAQDKCESSTFPPLQPLVLCPSRLISSHLIPARPLPSSTYRASGCSRSLGLPEEIIPPYPSWGLIALEHIEPQPPPFASPIPTSSHPQL
jgi:hypothetical protein